MFRRSFFSLFSLLFLPFLLDPNKKENRLLQNNALSGKPPQLFNSYDLRFNYFDVPFCGLYYFLGASLCSTACDQSASLQFPPSPPPPSEVCCVFFFFFSFLIFFSSPHPPFSSLSFSSFSAYSSILSRFLCHGWKKKLFFLEFYILLFKLKLLFLLSRITMNLLLVFLLLNAINPKKL